MGDLGEGGNSTILSEIKYKRVTGPHTYKRDTFLPKVVWRKITEDDGFNEVRSYLDAYIEWMKESLLMSEEVEKDEVALRDFLYEVAYENISSMLGQKLYEFLEGIKDETDKM